MPGPRVAITATMADCAIWLADWVGHHLHVADQLFVWVDAPSELEAARQFASDRVAIVPGQQIAHPSRLTQTLTRQDANANSAIQLAAMAGCDWLVHLDADELLVVSDPAVWDSDAGQLVLSNHEALPLWHTDAPFRDLSRFRVNGRHRFLLYDNGKAALRLGAPPVAARACGPHRFAGAAARPTDKAAILHYGVPGFDHWWRKYARLGAFSDLWCERPDEPIPQSFHTRSRDVVMAALRSGDASEAEAFFRAHMHGPEDGDVLHVRRDGDGRVSPV